MVREPPRARLQHFRGILQADASGAREHGHQGCSKQKTVAPSAKRAGRRDPRDRARDVDRAGPALDEAQLDPAALAALSEGDRC